SSGMPGTNSTATNMAAAAKPIHSMKAPGARASAANRISATAAQATTSQRRSTSAAPPRGHPRLGRVLLLAQRLARQLRHPGDRADHAAGFHRHQDELLVRRGGQFLERLHVLLGNEVVDGLHVA